METAQELRSEANRLRDLARGVGDDALLRQIQALIEELVARARALDGDGAA
jgi:hypothetical protein